MTSTQKISWINEKVSGLVDKLHELETILTQQFKNLKKALKPTLMQKINPHKESLLDFDKEATIQSLFEEELKNSETRALLQYYAPDDIWEGFKKPEDNYSSSIRRRGWLYNIMKRLHRRRSSSSYDWQRS